MNSIENCHKEISKYKFNLENKQTSKIRILSVMSILILSLIVALIISINTGRYAMSVSQMLTIVFGKILGLQKTWPDDLETVLFTVRIPEIISSLMIGGSLAVSGATYQGMFKNPMVSPDILGVSAGAGFGASLAILLSQNNVGIQIFAFAIGLASVGITYALSSLIKRGGNVVLILVLSGLVVGSVFSALISIIKYVADPDSKLPAITFWLMGSLSSVTQNEVMIFLIPFLIGMVPLFLIRFKLNVLSFGEEEAQALGINTHKIRLITIFCSTLLTAASVSVSGLIGWIGLIIPHVARIIVGPNYKILLPTSMIIGAIFLLLVNDLARCLFSVEIPLGIITSIIGAPFFLYLLLGKKWR